MIEVIYCHPTREFGGHHFDLACKFVSTYHTFLPHMEHRLIVVSNGGEPSADSRVLFSSIPNTEFLVRDDSGYDIGAFQEASRKSTAEMIVFFGGSTYFRREGWLKRMYEAFQKHGDTLYGAMGNQGETHAHKIVYPHVRTTGFWCSPKLFNSHPSRVLYHTERYEFEHGITGLSTWVLSQGKKVWVIGVSDERELHECDSMPGGFHNRAQHNLLVADRLCTIPYWSGE